VRSRNQRGATAGVFVKQCGGAIERLRQVTGLLAGESLRHMRAALHFQFNQIGGGARGLPDTQHFARKARRGERGAAAACYHGGVPSLEYRSAKRTSDTNMLALRRPLARGRRKMLVL
jgi:hypothetical protein